MILGIDEVGRGPLAGPLVVGAVILPSKKPDWVADLRDSKKLSVKKREELSALILAECSCGLGWVTASEIDDIGISRALSLACSRAVKSVQRLHTKFTEIVIDGKVNFLKGTALENFVSTMPKADDLVKEVSAASIIAKVARDHYMYELDSKYPGYGFSSHVGYGTAKHMAAISELGISPEHRKSFEPIKSMVGFECPSGGVVKNTTKIGSKGEDAVALYLKDSGHQILARNYKTKLYEIDIVSSFDGKIYFTEVKTRKNHDGIFAVDKKKLDKMQFAAECFLKSHKEYAGLDPLLAVASVNGDYKLEDFVVIR